MLVSMGWLHGHGARGCAPGAPVLEKAISLGPGLFHFPISLTLQIKPQGNVISPVPFPVMLESCWVITSLSSYAAPLSAQQPS